MSTTITKRNPDNAQQLSQANGGAPQQQPAQQPTYSPRFDIWENDEQLVLYGDLPGVGPDDLEVHFENRQLTIHGRPTPPREGAEQVYTEYFVGDFRRSFMIGELIDAENISAEMRGGVLVLRLPKAAQARARRIEVKAG